MAFGHAVGPLKHNNLQVSLEVMAADGRVRGGWSTWVTGET